MSRGTFTDYKYYVIIIICLSREWIIFLYGTAAQEDLNKIT